jgi:hypothetical protein
MLRWTVLRHVAGPGLTRPGGNQTMAVAAGPEHWDWLFEPPVEKPGGRAANAQADRPEPQAESDGAKDGLWTWATDPLTWRFDRHTRQTHHPPHLRPQRTVTAALKLADHRRRYLDYQGPVSGSRGHVTPLARGRYQPLICQPELFEAFVWLEHGNGRPGTARWRVRFTRSAIGQAPNAAVYRAAAAVIQRGEECSGNASPWRLRIDKETFAGGSSAGGSSWAAIT